jgi:hypothetical protein
MQEPRPPGFIAGRCDVRHCKARHGEARRSEAHRSEAHRSEVRHCEARSDEAIHLNDVRHGSILDSVAALAMTTAAVDVLPGT